MTVPFPVACDALPNPPTSPLPFVIPLLSRRGGTPLLSFSFSFSSSLVVDAGCETVDEWVVSMGCARWVSNWGRGEDGEEGEESKGEVPEGLRDAPSVILGGARTDFSFPLLGSGAAVVLKGGKTCLRGGGVDTGWLPSSFPSLLGSMVTFFFRSSFPFSVPLFFSSF